MEEIQKILAEVIKQQLEKDKKENIVPSEATLNAITTLINLYRKDC